MNTNQKITFKLTTLIAAIFFSISSVFAQPGVVDIVMRGSNNGSNASEILQIPAEQNKLYSIIFIKESGEKFNKTIRLTSSSQKVNFVLPSGFYRVRIIEINTGYTQQYTTNLF